METGNHGPNWTTCNCRYIKDHRELCISAESSRTVVNVGVTDREAECA